MIWVVGEIRGLAVVREVDIGMDSSVKRQKGGTLVPPHQRIGCKGRNWIFLD